MYTPVSMLARAAPIRNAWRLGGFLVVCLYLYILVYLFNLSVIMAQICVGKQSYLQFATSCSYFIQSVILLSLYSSTTTLFRAIYLEIFCLGSIARNKVAHTKVLYPDTCRDIEQESRNLLF
jgi:hypothetical protein